MADGATTHLVVNTGGAAPELITGFAAGDRVGLVGFYGGELVFSDAAGASVHQSLVAGADGVPALQLAVWEAGASAPAAVVLLVGVDHALAPDAVTGW